jgi:adenylylsulfate kinase
MKPTSTDASLALHPPMVDRRMRETVNQHNSFILWFTGLSGAGKSTLSQYLELCLFKTGHRTINLDGDHMRHGLCSDLGFSIQDRHENIRRIGEVCKLFVDGGVIVLAAFISPLREDREKIRGLVPADDFIEIYCSASLEVCEERDTKGLYKKARSGEIANFTGISSPYEAPTHPQLVIDTSIASLEDCAKVVLNYLQSQGKLKCW